MKAMVLGVALAAATTMPAYAFDGVTAEGAILCSSPSDYREAEMAVRSGDDAWLKSIGCDTAKAGSRIIIISDNRELSQVRWVDKGVTAWMGRWNYAFLMEDFSMFRFWKDKNKYAENAIREHIKKCSLNYAIRPEGYDDYTVLFKISSYGENASIKPEFFLVQHDTINNEHLRVFIANAYSSFKSNECKTVNDPALVAAGKTNIPPSVIVKF